MVSLDSTNFAEHFACVDMVQIDFRQAAKQLSEDAVVLEIWEGGALVQTSCPLSKGSRINVTVKKSTEVAAEVTDCKVDSGFGYLVSIAVDAPAKWFPQGYVPEWHHALNDYAIDSSLTAPNGYVC